MQTMDGQPNGVNPLALDTIEPAGDVVVKDKTELSMREIEAYARKTGRSVVKIEALAKRAILGELTERLGGSRVGSAMLIESEDDIRQGIQVCDEFIERFANVPEAVPAIMKVRLGYVDLLVKAAHTHIKSKKDAGPDMSNQPPQNTPFPASVPVQVNIQTNVTQPSEVQTKVGE